MQMLVKKSGSAYAASDYAKAATAAGIKLITWTLERSGPLGGGGGWYYGTVNDITNNDGDMLELLHVLNKDVGVVGVFADWPATVTFYSNCVMKTAKCADVATNVTTFDNSALANSANHYFSALSVLIAFAVTVCY